MSTPSTSSNGYLSLVRKDGYVILSMQKEPVNSLNLAMWQQLEAALDSLEADPSVRGLIITTGLQRDVFTAGNDLLELYAPKTSEARYADFWVTSNRFLAKLYMSRLSTIAAIRGACPAGGCMMSMCCDHRIMSTVGAIGLNEVQLGIRVPKYWGLLMARLIGLKAAEKLLTVGKLVSPQEAESLGLVDKVVDMSDVLSTAEQLMQQVIKSPSLALAGTKKTLREDFCSVWEQYYVVEPVGAWSFLNEPATLKTLEGALQRLSSAGGKRAKM